MMKFAKPKPLTQLVADELRQRIVSGQIELGEMLSEVRLSRELDVSRTPIREAFNRLEMEGLVRTVPQRGTFVFSLAPDELGKICDLRVALETAALRSAFEHSPKTLLKRWGQCVKQMELHLSKGNERAYLHDDADFHQILLESADNRFLCEAYQTIAAKMAALRMRLGDHPDHMKKSFIEHKKILALVDQGELERAMHVLELHIGRKEGSYWTLASQKDS